VHVTVHLSGLVADVAYVLHFHVYRAGDIVFSKFVREEGDGMAAAATAVTASTTELPFPLDLSLATPTSRCPSPSAASASPEADGGLEAGSTRGGGINLEAGSTRGGGINLEAGSTRSETLLDKSISLAISVTEWELREANAPYILIVSLLDGALGTEAKEESVLARGSRTVVFLGNETLSSSSSGSSLPSADGRGREEGRAGWEGREQTGEGEGWDAAPAHVNGQKENHRGEWEGEDAGDGRGRSGGEGWRGETRTETVRQDAARWCLGDGELAFLRLVEKKNELAFLRLVERDLHHT
jgi:hypothetical protein